MARYYDTSLDIATFGRYLPFMKQVISMTKIKPEDKILDLGAGTGRNACLMTKYLSEKGELTGVDVSEDMIAQFRKRCANFPNAKVTNMIVENAFQSLKQNGEFLILDYNGFLLPKLPFYLRLPFKILECPYAFDFIKKDWKRILADAGFTDFEEYFFFHRFVRLLKAVKPNNPAA